MNAPQAVAVNRLKELRQLGQSVWLDYIRRNIIANGNLKRMVQEDGLGGVTSNPAIFEKAIAGSDDYTDMLAQLAKQKLDPKTVFERLAVRDIQDAADILRPVYDQTQRRDGYVSLEVSPHLAKDTQGTLDEARRLWKDVGRPNVMIKVPATPEGIPAIQQLLTEGLNINITLLFAQEAYVRVAEAFLKGLEDRAAKGGDIGHVGSVASFFISRIDSMIDKMLEERLGKASTTEEKARLNGLMGKVAIANGKQTYQRYLDLFSGPRWEALAKKGAKTQRVLWASTSTKNPKYRDVLYVEELIGKDTVNTMPPATFDAFKDHGRARATLVEDLDGAGRVMQDLAKVGISMTDVTGKLLDEGVRLFSEPFDKLLETVSRQCQKMQG